MSIRLEKLCKSYGGRDVLRDFSLELPERGTICLFGASGCGKTTLLQCVAGLVPPDSGAIHGISGKISYVFQEDRLLPWVSALENVAAVLPASRRGEAEGWLARAGLAGDEAKKPAMLSGGMRQRVALARALAYGGSLYLLDEPFHALDNAAKQALMELLKRETADCLKLFVTHDREEAEALSDCIYFLEGPPLRVSGYRAVSAEKVT